MSAVVKVVKNIGKAAAGVVKKIVKAVGDLAKTLWNSVLSPSLEFIVGLFGIHDEDIIQTEVKTMRIIQDDVQASNLITMIKLEEQKQPIGVIDRLMAYTDVTRKRYDKYFTYGDTVFIDKLPDSNLKALFVDNATVKQVIDNTYNTDCTILNSRIGAINKTEFVSFQLQNSYGYKPYNNTMPYNKYTYSVDHIDYNYDTNEYDVHISAYEDQTTETITTTEITITDNGDGTSNKHTKIIKEVKVTGTQQGQISDTTTTTEKDETIDTGSEDGSTTTTTTNSIEPNVILATDKLTIAAYEPVRYYVVKYYTHNSSEWYYWIYKVGSGGYPELDNEDIYTSNLDMLPIVTVRNSRSNINEDKNSDRYKQSKQMCKYIGIDLDDITDSIKQNPNIDEIEDCFIHFGLLPSETSDIVSKALFLTFDYIYNDNDLQHDNSKYVATISEGSFNAAIAWTDQNRTIIEGVIGKKGYYTHKIDGKNLILQWQATEEQYVTLTISNLSSITFINRQGLFGTVGKDIDQDGFFVPISYYFVKKLSPLEQYELFNRTLLLSVYAAKVIHLEWYETKAFASFLKIIGTALAVFTLGSSLTAVIAGKIALSSVLTEVAVSVGATMLLKIVMNSHDGGFLKVIASIMYVALMDYQLGDGFKGTFDASKLTNSVTSFASTLTTINTPINMYTSAEMEKIKEKQQALKEKIKRKEEELDKAKKALDPYLDTYDVLEIANTKELNAYLTGVDALMYRAIDIQYNYSAVYDYDVLTSDFYNNKFRLGLV